MRGRDDDTERTCRRELPVDGGVACLMGVAAVPLAAWAVGSMVAHQVDAGYDVGVVVTYVAICALTLVADGLARGHDARRLDAADALAAAERVLAGGLTDDDRDDLVWP
jgi:hypothetical protein